MIKSSTSNRGMTLEFMINKTIEMYRDKNLALIQKIPTPISPGKLNRKTNKLENAFFMKKSTVDYIGVVQEIAVCFDAKETNTDKFILDNLKTHQYEFMRDFEKQGGVSFILLYFKNRDEIFYIRFSDIEKYKKICKNKKINYILYDELDKDYSINVKNKITFSFLKKLEMDLERR